MGRSRVIMFPTLCAFVIGLVEFGNVFICASCESKEHGLRNGVAAISSKKRDRRETTVPTRESIVYDLVPPGFEADNITRLQIDNLQEALGLQGKEDEMEFSICLWFQQRLDTSVPTLFSYAASAEQVNAIFIYFEKRGLAYLNDITGNYANILFTFVPLQWYHFCLVMKRLNPAGQANMSYSITLYIDGCKVNEDLSDAPLSLGGILVIGQDQDGLGTSFVKDQSLIGRVSPTGFAEALEPIDIEALFHCNLERDPVPIAWRTYGRVSNASLDICKYSGSLGTLLPFHTSSQSEAENFCEMLNMKLALPKSEEENRMFSGLLSQESSCHGAPFLSHNIGWLGISYDGDSGELYETDSLRMFNRLMKNISHIKFPNVVLMSNELWRPDWGREACPLCFGKPSGEFYLLGLDKSKTEMKPRVLYPRINAEGAFFLYSIHGLTVEKRGEWKLIDTNHNITIASTKETFFLGRKFWDLQNITKYGSFHSSPKSIKLTITKCSLDEFSCNDGECIPMARRCDFRQDCVAEGEDEAGCNILHIPEGYERGAPPSQRPFNVTTCVSILKVSSIDIMTETLQVSMKIDMFWSDSRLTFKNLLNKNKVNYLGQHLATLWTPHLVILNEETLAGTAEANKELFVTRNGQPFRVGQDYIYKGSENSLLLMQKQSYYISCKFDMRAFPFDIQDCQINITIGNTASDSIRLSADLNPVIRNLKLNEYDVLACNLTVTDNRMILRVILRRFPEYHILSSYFPVFLLHLLGYGTLFIDPRDFQDRGTMSLTSLLVLISFYSDSAMALPKTSYLKVIDFWYIFSITFLSLIIGVHLLTNRVKGRENPSNKITMVKMFLLSPARENYGDDVRPKGLSSNISRNFNASVLFGAKIFFGIIYVLFHVVYWSTLGFRI